MQTTQIVAPRYPTQKEIERGIARGRAERAHAFTAATKAVFDFLFGRRIKHMSISGRIAPLTG